MGKKVGKAKKARSKGSAPSGRRSGGRQGFRPPGLRVWEMLTLADETDQNGRLLLEDSAPERAIAKADQAGIPRKAVVASYADTPSRLSGLMNESAYEALRRDTGEILDGFAWLTQNYLYLGQSEKGSVQCLFDVSHLGLSLPLLLMGRADNPVPRKGRLPSYVASLFKASRGVYSAAVDMVNKMGPESGVTAAEITVFADEQGHFRRPQTQRVCAAPTRLIQRTLGVMLTGEGADPGRSGLPDLVGFDRLWEFYSLEMALSDALSRYGFVLTKLVGEGAGGDPGELFGRMVPDGDRLRPFGDWTEEVLRQANSAQAGLNEILGRGKVAARITFDDLLKMI